MLYEVITYNSYLHLYWKLFQLRIYEPVDGFMFRITSYNVCYTKLLRNIMTKDQLLAIGDRYEESIAAHRKQDAAYR